LLRNSIKQNALKGFLILIKDRRPYYIRNLIENYYKFWTYYFIEPQFRSVGKNLDINKPWNLDIYGDDIFVGDRCSL
jgi:hypothetical protein